MDVKTMNLVLDGKLAKTIEQAEVDVVHSRLTAIKEMSGNPMGVGIKKFGNATAFSIKNIPGPAFNTVKGLTDEDETEVNHIIEYYKDRGIPIRFELTPTQGSSDLLSCLSEAGLYQTDFHTTLYGGLSEELGTIDPEITIRKLKENEFDTFGDIYTKGFQMPTFLKSGIAQNNEVLYDNDNWHFYLASVENEPAGIGVLFIKDGIATLAAAATVPNLRNKGIHSALITARINQAKMLDSKLVVGQARFALVS